MFPFRDQVQPAGTSGVPIGVTYDGRVSVILIFVHGTFPLFSTCMTYSPWQPGDKFDPLTIFFVNEILAFGLTVGGD
jgi:hypothetical protein